MRNERSARDPVDRINAFLTGLEHGLLVVLLVGLIGLGLSQILLRNFAGISLVWADAMMRAMVLWLAMLAGAIAAGRLKHIRIDLIDQWLGEPWARRINRITLLLTSLVCVLVGSQCFRLVLLEREFPGEAFLGIPVWAVLLILPIGFGLMAARFFARALTDPMPEPSASMVDKPE